MPPIFIAQNYLSAFSEGFEKHTRLYSLRPLLNSNPLTRMPKKTVRITPSRLFSLKNFRRSLSHENALPQLALLAILVGVITAFVMILFRSFIEVGAESLFGINSENFEMLDIVVRFLSPIIGATLIGVLLFRLPSSKREAGVAHVMSKLSEYQTRLPVINALVQFFAGGIALVAGLSGGREGPAIHLGATGASVLGSTLKLPYNSIRILVACGAAAAIASSFNTPIAGVIFAMEVVVMEYSIATFIPVIISAVTGAVLVRAVFGSVAAFTVPPVDLTGPTELPYIIAAGFVIGCFAALFVQLVELFARSKISSYWVRASIAGVLTGCVGLVIPQALGIGYDTVDLILAEQYTVSLLITFLVAKLVVTAGCVGLGIPLGVIGPSLVIGATLGALAGTVGGALMPASASPISLYVLLGMTAMMAAILQAPLFSLMAVLELTANPNIILPAMLIIVVATMTMSQVFRKKSVFTSRLSALGLGYPPAPMTQYLLRTGVESLMTRNFLVLDPETNINELRQALESHAVAGKPFPEWIIVESEPTGETSILRGEEALNASNSNFGSPPKLDEMPQLKRDLPHISVRSTLAEALWSLEQTESETLCVRELTNATVGPIVGVLSRRHIVNHSALTQGPPIAP